MTPAEQYTALEQGRLVRAIRRDVIVASGPDAERFLQGQLSQDVAAIGVGVTRWTLHLQPNGRLIGIARITRRADDTFVLDTEAGVGEHIHTGLSRFLIRTKCTLTLTAEIESVQWVSNNAPLGPETSLDAAAPLVVPALPWVEGYDLIGRDLLPMAIPDSVADDVGEAYRIATGQLSAGRDLTDATIPSETGFLDAAVTFGKGCYVGQELVERIDSRGRIVRSLRRLRSVGADVAGLAGFDPQGLTNAELVDDSTSEVVGHLTSVALHPVSQQLVAIGLVRARVEPGTSVSVQTGSERVSLLVHS